jgi:hypothetical protein
MVLDVRPLTEEDYDNILVGWWKDWKWEPPQRDFLPGDGTGGIIVLDSGNPICAGFLYVTNSKVCWVDWIISNRQYRDKEKRKHAIRLLIDTLTNIGVDTGNKYAYALIKHKSLTGVYEEFGYTKGDSYTSEMIKVLQ